MIAEVNACAWPMTRAGEALEALAAVCGMPVVPIETAAPPDGFTIDGAETQTRWLQATAARLGLEVEPIEATFGEIDRMIRGAGPALLRIESGDAQHLLILRAATRRTAALVAPDGSVRQVRIDSIRAVLCEPLEAPLANEINRLLDGTGLHSRRRPRAYASLVRERLAPTFVASCWLVRLPPGASVRAQCSLARLWSRVAMLVGAHVSAYVLWIVSWWIVGRATLQGQLDRGWIAAWALMLITLIPFELLVTWLQGRLSIEAGALLKRRLLCGALRLEPEEIRHQGAGQLLGRVIEAQAIDALALSGGCLALVAAIEVTVAAAVLTTVTGWLSLLLGLCSAFVAGTGWWFFGRRLTWTRHRLAMTHDLVERMVGHRTRLAQEPRDRWHDGEDHILGRYLTSSRAMDRAAVWLTALAPRGWLLVAVIGVSPLFIASAPTSATLAVALGGILLAYRAFRRLAVGVSYLAGAAIAWTEAAPMFDAAARVHPTGLPALALAPRASASDRWPLVDGQALSFRYSNRAEPVLRECNVRIRRGDRVLLEGPSGGGKSTLASLLTGLRAPESGVLLLDGVDRQTLGVDGWRRRVVAAPQFHENHVFTGTFAFNLLIGSQWPPRPGDVERAEAVCRDLGLGDLLARMPAGLLQQVGETGWQLSHGEQSRLFIARALLQNAEFVVLDESFAQLDPENLLRSLRCVLDRAPTVMVIAHT
jgi:ATP-binding cassette subfamily B protein